MNSSRKFNITTLTCIALLIALEIIFTRFIAINTQFLRISVGMIPVAVAGIMFGPIWGGICGAAGDILGMLIFPSGAYFPGFTITAALTGIVYGLFLYRHRFSLPRLIIASIIVCIGLNLLLDTLWLNIMYSSGFIALLPARTIKCVLNIFIYSFIIYILWSKILLRIPAIRQLTGTGS